MKNRYDRLSKKEKKEAIKDFCAASENNSNIILRIKRLRLIGIFGILYSLVMFILDIFKELGIFDVGLNKFDNLLFSYIIDGCLLIFCFVFVLKANLLLREQVNKYLIAKK